MPLQPFSSHHGMKQIKPALGLFAASSPNWLLQWILPRGCMSPAHRLETLLSFPQEDWKGPLLSFPILPHSLLSVALIKTTAQDPVLAVGEGKLNQMFLNF